MTKQELKHFGVAGMKWGVRKKANGYISPNPKMPFMDRLDQKWVDKAMTEAYTQVYSKAAPKIKRGTELLNSNPKYKNQNFKKESPLRKEYYDEYSKMVTQQLNAAVGTRAGVLNPFNRTGQSPFRRFELKFEFDVNNESRPRAMIKRTDTRLASKEARKEANAVRKFKHSETLDSDLLPVELVFDELSHIVDIMLPTFDPVDEPMTQSESWSEADLAHFGIMGMRWGIRRGRNVSPSGSKDTKGKTKNSDEEDEKPKETKPESTSTGSDKPQQQAKPASQKTSTTKVPVKELSDQELRDKISRIEMEKKYSALTKGKLEKGKEVLVGILVGAATTEANKYVKQYVSKSVESMMTNIAKNAVS